MRPHCAIWLERQTGCYYYQYKYCSPARACAPKRQLFAAACHVIADGYPIFLLATPSVPAWGPTFPAPALPLSRAKPLCRQEPDFHALVEHLGNALQHRERVPFVVGVLKPADHRCGGPKFLCKLALAQSRFSPQFI